MGTRLPQSPGGRWEGVRSDHVENRNSQQDLGAQEGWVWDLLSHPISASTMSLPSLPSRPAQTSVSSQTFPDHLRWSIPSPTPPPPHPLPKIKIPSQWVNKDRGLRNPLASSVLTGTKATQASLISVMTFSHFSKYYLLTVPVWGLATTPKILQDATGWHEGSGPAHPQTGPRNPSPWLSCEIHMQHPG